MRYYEIVITDPNAPNRRQIYTSWVNGQNDPGALNLSLDCQVVPYSTPRGLTVIELSGVSLQNINQASNLNQKNIQISAGFKPGLPLATKASRNQGGPILNGFILQSFGNWIGNDMTLNMVISPGSWPARPAPAATTAREQAAQASTTSTATVPTGAPDAPINVVWRQAAGTPLYLAIQNALRAALPGYSIAVNIRPDILVGYDVNATYQSIQQFAQALKVESRQIVNSTEYAGVEIRVDADNTIRVYDGSSGVINKDIEFYDLIGQPTWIGPNQIQFKCPMRADLNVGYTVTLPPGYYGIMPAQSNRLADYRNQSSQKGTFTVTEIRHVGNFRQPDANSWVTIVNCVYAPTSARAITAASNG